MSKMGDRMTHFRRKIGMSVMQVAEFMEVTPEEVIDWEKGDKTPDDEQLKRLSALYGLKSEKEFTDGVHIDIDINEKNKGDGAHKSIRMWKKFPYPMVCVLIYLILGFSLDCWHPGWLIFLTVPIYYGTISAISYKRGNRFPYPVLCVFIYLLIGFLTSVWTWSLFIFLTIPIYYWLVNGSWKGFWSNFPYATLCCVVYLVLGFALNWWHPGWLIFLTIPIFHSIVSMFRNK